MREGVNGSGSLAALFAGHAADEPGALDELLRVLGFEGRAIEFLRTGVGRDVARWRADPAGSYRFDNGVILAWADATIVEYRAHLVSLLRGIGVDPAGHLLKGRRGTPAKRAQRGQPR
ncbi:MAG TPA: hypothetical protein VGQ20_05805 [Acidimicrobiales bacterium]|jgi:hypothetical protein|nr:hypothetical protein [Acidimicrobiales bacterium]